MKTSEVLNKAADLIEERGWAQGGENGVEDPWGYDGSSPVCLEGAIVAALGVCGGLLSTLANECPAGQAVIDYLGPEAISDPAGFSSIYVYNDARDRTASEVIEVLRACALIEAAREEQDAAWETYAEVVRA